MKLSLALGPRQPLSRQTALGCVATNLAFPGFGSLLARRKVGYFQIAITAAGFALTTLAGIPAIAWGLSNWSRFQQQEDPMQNLQDMWLHFRWPLLGIALCFFSFLWALTTNASLMAEARANDAMRPLPPKLNR